MNRDLKKFWRFAYERQAIWSRRAAGQPEPWTDDPILRKYRFTNVHRELDSGTRALRFFVTSNDARPVWLRTWNTMLYRMFNREELWASRLVFIEDAKASTVRKRLKEWEGPMWTDATQTNGYFNLPGETVFDRIMWGVSKWDAKWMSRELRKVDSTKDAYAIVRTQPLMGKFMAWQVTLDLVPLFGRWTDDEWAITYKAYGNSGSGIGLQKVGMELSELRDRQSDHLAALGLDWRDVAWKGHERLTIADLEHTLCEWVKYDRFAAGLHTRARRFR